MTRWKPHWPQKQTILPPAPPHGSRQSAVPPASPSVLKPASGDALLTTQEAAQLMRLSGRTLERYRVDGGGPEYLKLGRGKRSRVYYLTSALREWVLKNKHTSTSEYRDRKPD